MLINLHGEQYLLLVCPTSLGSTYLLIDTVLRINRCYECPLN